MGERVEVEVDEATARWLRGCAQQRGQSVAVAAAAQLREDALAAAARSFGRWLDERPSYVEDAEAERDAALHA